MSAEYTHHAEAVLTSFTFNLAADVTGAISGPCDFHGPPQCAFPAANQGIGGTGDLSHADSHRRIRKESVFAGDQVQFEKIAVSQNPSAGYTVNGFIVHADADRSGK